MGFRSTSHKGFMDSPKTIGEVQSIGTSLQEIRTALAFEVLLSPDTQSLNQWDQAAAVSTEAVAHLASDDARWVNGQTLQVNGGLL